MAGRILYVNHNPLGSASTYRQAGLAKYLSRKGFRCAFLGRSRRPFGGKDEGDEGGWKAFLSRTYWREPLVRSTLANARLYRRLASDSDFVHVNRGYPYTSGVILAGGSSAKLVVDMEDWDGFGGYSSYARLYGPKGALLTVSELVLPRRADLVLAVSRHILKIMRVRGIPDSRLVYLPNGVDLELFDGGISKDAARRSLGLRTEPVVMYTSTFWSWESQLHETALATFRAVSLKVPEARFLMTGPGELSFRRQIDALGLGEKVRFTGYVPREEVPRLMAAVDVAVHVISEHPFHQASSPMVVPEYMAMGKAVVAPRVGELASMLGGGAGVLVDHPDPEGLASAIVRLLRRDDLRTEIGRQAHIVAAQRYSYDVLSGRLASVLGPLAK